MSVSHYNLHHALQFHAPQEDLITYEELNHHDQQNKRNALSMLSIGEGRKIFGLCYWTVDSATQWFLKLRKTRDLRIMTPYLGSMDRIEYHRALRELTTDTWTPPLQDDLRRHFYQALHSPQSLSALELLTVRLFVHMDDVGILKEWDEEGALRPHSYNTLLGALPGSWLVRRSSVQDSDIIKARVLCVKNKKTGRIENILLGHLYGLGYAQLIGVKSNEQLPFSHSSDPLPATHFMSGSFLDLLHCFKDMIDMDKRLA